MWAHNPSGNCRRITHIPTCMDRVVDTLWSQVRALHPFAAFPLSSALGTHRDTNWTPSMIGIIILQLPYGFIKYALILLFHYCDIGQIFFLALSFQTTSRKDRKVGQRGGWLASHELSTLVRGTAAEAELGHSGFSRQLYTASYSLCSSTFSMFIYLSPTFQELWGRLLKFIGPMGSTIPCDGYKANGHAFIPHLGLKHSIIFLGRCEQH